MDESWHDFIRTADPLATVTAMLDGIRFSGRPIDIGGDVQYILLDDPILWGAFRRRKVYASWLEENKSELIEVTM